MGVVSLADALASARAAGLDLVEVDPNGSPPVCRVLDYGKWKYQQAKKERDARKHQRGTMIHEVRMRPRIGQHDMELKVRTVERLLAEGDKVKLSVMFRGREMSHPEIGQEVLARALERARLAEAAAVLKTASAPAFLRAYGVEAPSAEGYLFPDTYHFVPGMTAEQILGRMVRRLHAKLRPDVRERARARHLTIHEVLTLASIIEREAVVREERRLISAVFWNRLQLGMPLQADPTVQYALGKDRRPLRRSDLLWDHPYNTYVRPGLPPGPIASPGLDAIEAALDPAPVGYLFFVKKDDQRHHFSTTLEEHERAIAHYHSSPAAEEHDRGVTRFRFPRLR